MPSAVVDLSAINAALVHGVPVSGRVTDPTGATRTFAHSGTDRDYTATMTTALGRTTTYRVQEFDNGDIRLTMQTYDDSDFAALEEAVKAMEKLGLK